MTDFFQMNSDCTVAEVECFPFANDNAGTIRMRSNGHGLILHDDQEVIQNGSAIMAANEAAKSSSQSLPQRSVSTREWSP